MNKKFRGPSVRGGISGTHPNVGAVLSSLEPRGYRPARDPKSPAKMGISNRGSKSVFPSFGGPYTSIPSPEVANLTSPGNMQIGSFSSCPESKGGGGERGGSKGGGNALSTINAK